MQERQCINLHFQFKISIFITLFPQVAAKHAVAMTVVSRITMAAPGMCKFIGCCI